MRRERPRIRPQLSLRDLAIFVVALASGAWYTSLWRGSLGTSFGSLAFLAWSAATVAATVWCVYLIVTGRQRAASWIVIGWMSSVAAAVVAIVAAMVI